MEYGTVDARLGDLRDVRRRRSQAQQLYERFGDRVGFATLNVREAHPRDRYPQPATPPGRRQEPARSQAGVRADAQAARRTSLACCRRRRRRRTASPARSEVERVLGSGRSRPTRAQAGTLERRAAPRRPPACHGSPTSASDARRHARRPSGRRRPSARRAIRGHGHGRRVPSGSSARNGHAAARRAGAR